MAGSRTLKLSILADVDDLKAKLSQGETSVGGFGDKIDGFAKKAGLAFAAAGAAAAAYAGKLLVDGVKSAIEDEAAQAKLAASLEKVAGASKETVAAVEAYISKTSIAKGVTDDVLRPAFDRLVRSTGDVAEAQKALNISLDISAATGKDLETVTTAVGRAIDGNTAGLSRLGLGFDAADLKGKSFAEIFPMLEERFGGAAATAADTFEGKLSRLKIAFDEGKETVGSYVLDALTPMVTLFVDQAIPAIGNFSNEVGGKMKPVITFIGTFIRDTLLPAFRSLWSFLNESIIPTLSGILLTAFEGAVKVMKTVVGAINDNKASFVAFYNELKPIINWLTNTVAPLFKTVLKVAFDGMAKSLDGAIDAFGVLASAVSKVLSAINAIINTIKNNPIVSGIAGVFDRAFGGGRAIGGPVSAGTSYLVGERGPELFTPAANGMITPNNRMGGGTTINLNVTGAIDPEGTARAIIDVLNQSFARGTLGSLAFRS